MAFDSNDSLDISLSSDVKAAIPEMIELRRDLHRHPELGFQETRTQRLVLERLGEWGIEARPLAGTGVVGLIRGSSPGKVLLLRADLDALAIDEKNDVPWRSQNQGVMHACGHDAHVAMLLVAARLLRRGGLDSGTVKLMFQPAEEGLGGAGRMLEEGILEDPPVDAALALHVWSGFQAGQVAALDGPVAASVDGFRIVVAGKGTHAAVPDAGVDPVLIAAQIITAGQSLITRRTSPVDPAVLSFSAVNAGRSFNVIPDSAEIRGTFRTFDSRVREKLRNELEQLCSSVAAALGGSAEYESTAEHIPVVNDSRIAGLAREAAAGVVGEHLLIEPTPLMMGEDFGELLERVPGALVLLGCGEPRAEERFPHHHPRFSIDEMVLPIGVEISLRFCRAFLG